MTKKRDDGKLTRVFKWVGYLTAIFSLCGTLVAIAKYVYDRGERRKKVATLLATGAEEQKARDYTASWQTLEKAVQLEPNSGTVRAAQEGLALAWLEDVHLQESQKFSDVTEKLEPILERAIASGKPGPREADLRAHMGWIYFLEAREGRLDLDPTVPYREAVKQDPTNPYAHAMWGHWILWQDCEKIEEAKGHFAAALASQRERDYVRSLEMAALLNCHNHQADLEVIRVANAMREERRAPDDGTRDHILSIYYFEFTPKTAATSEFISAVPPAEHVATFHWLFDGVSLDANNKAPQAYYLGELEEAAGQREAAITNYRLALRRLSSDSTQGQAADEGVKRLSRLH
jgi:tetratricopeptide (TPR) repeat protein